MWIVLLIAFSAGMLAVGVQAARRMRGYDDFLTAGRAHGAGGVALSIAATSIGATATVGLMDQAAAGGFPYFWFMGAAAIGLAVQGFTVAARIRETGARTFSEVVERQFGRRVQTAVSVLIVLGWTAIVAAQFKAAGLLASSFSGGRLGFGGGAVVAAALIVCYTVPGGQRAVIMTDWAQFGLLAVGLAGLAWLADGLPEPAAPVPMAWLNERFGIRDWFHHLLIVGGIYVISPNLFSRSFAARDGRAARRAAFLAAPLLALAGLAAAWTGVRAAAGGAAGPVFEGLLARAGLPWSVLLGFCVLAAIVSSADTTLLVTASIAQNDLLRRPSVAGVRLWAAGIAAAALALVLAAPAATLYQFLFAAYEVFAPAVVPLVFAGFYARRGMDRRLVWAGLVLGAAAGLYGPALALGRAWGLAAGDWPAKRDVLSAGFLAVSALAAWAAARGGKGGA